MLLMDIAGAPIRSQPNGLKVGENFAEIMEVVVLWLLADASARGRVDNKGQINRKNLIDREFINARNSTDENLHAVLDFFIAA